MPWLSQASSCFLNPLGEPRYLFLLWIDHPLLFALILSALCVYVDVRSARSIWGRLSAAMSALTTAPISKQGMS